MLAALAAVAVLAPGNWVIDPSASTLRYRVIHKLHAVEATSKEVEGKVVVRPDGTVLTEVRAPVASFKSGDGNRDEHMVETLNVGSHPFVVFKGIAHVDARAGPELLQGEVDLHGVKKRYPVSVTLLQQPDGTFRVQGTFEVSLEAHGIQRPSLLFIQVDDACQIELNLLLREEK